MATRNIIPNGDSEGNFGAQLKRWLKGWFVDIHVSGSLTDGTDSVTINDLANPTGGGDMLKATYDPTNINGSAFDKANEVGIEQITGTILAAPQLTATADDYNPTGFATSNMVCVDIDANNREITGLAAPAAGVNRIVHLCNVNTSGFDLKFKNNNAGSSAVNRLLMRDNFDKAIKPNETAAFWYDHSVSRWRPYNRIG